VAITQISGQETNQEEKTEEKSEDESKEQPVLLEVKIDSPQSRREDDETSEQTPVIATDLVDHNGEEKQL